jgi:hypothetical protein
MVSGTHTLVDSIRRTQVRPAAKWENMLLGIEDHPYSPTG